MSTEEPKADATKRVSLANEEEVKGILVNTVFGLWNIVNNLTRLKPSRRPFYRVSVFGSARVDKSSPVYHEVKELTTQLTKIGCEIITGGGPGLMQAANEGAMAAGQERKQRSMGIRITLPFEQSANQYVEEVFEHQTFFTRLHHFVMASDAFVVVPGGIGTVLEMLMVWQLLQVKHLEPLPLILLGEMYEELVDWFEKHMLNSVQTYASPEDLKIPRCVREVSQVVQIISDHRSGWLKNNQEGV